MKRLSVAEILCLHSAACQFTVGEVSALVSFYSFSSTHLKNSISHNIYIAANVYSVEVRALSDCTLSVWHKNFNGGPTCLKRLVWWVRMIPSQPLTGKTVSPPSTVSLRQSKSPRTLWWSRKWNLEGTNTERCSRERGCLCMPSKSSSTVSVSQVSL